jgi:hypothetical protein
VTVRARVRGIYATALTRLLRERGIEVVQPSAAIAARFGFDAAADGDEADPEGYDAAVSTTDDRLGIGLSGDGEAVATLREILSDLAIDTFAYADDTSREAVVEGVVTGTRGGGARVDLGSRGGYLSAHAIDGEVEEGECCRVQVVEPAPPWRDERPRLDTGVRLDGGGLLELRREGGSDAGTDGGSDPDSDSGSASKSSHPDRRTTIGTGDVIDLLPTDVPSGWRARLTERGDEASFDALDAALADVATRAADLDRALAADAEEATDTEGTADTERTAGPATDAPRELWTGRETTWIRLGRRSRFALDEHRRAVTATMAGHHRIKAGTDSASAAVDFAESACGAAVEPADMDDGSDEDDLDFPLGVTTRQFGPREGERVAIAHGKPDGREIVLGRGEVSTIDPDGTLVLRREMSSRGVYDGIGTDRRAGDVAITRFKEGRWWYQTRYRSADGEPRGTYVNVCAPVELFPDAVRYVDLYVDVVKRPDGTVERVDDDELDAAVAEGLVSDPLTSKARSVAAAIEAAL